MDDKPEATPRKNRFARFNNALAYGLSNIFRLIWTIVKFGIKLSGVALLLFPIVILALCIISPENAIAALEAIMRYIQSVINIFR